VKGRKHRGHDRWDRDWRHHVETAECWPFEIRAEWRYVPGVWAAQLDDLPDPDNDPEDVPLGHTWRPVAGEWETDWTDFVPDWWWR
jgi:hypothetical protein